MDAISSIKTKTTNAIDYRLKTKEKTIDYRNKISNEQADSIIKSAEDLINDPNFRPYFFKTLYLIGPGRFIEAMDIARKAIDANCKPCIFVKRLKEYRDAI